MFGSHLPSAAPPRPRTPCALAPSRPRAPLRPRALCCLLCPHLSHHHQSSLSVILVVVPVRSHWLRGRSIRMRSSLPTGDAGPTWLRPASTLPELILQTLPESDRLRIPQTPPLEQSKPVPVLPQTPPLEQSKPAPVLPQMPPLEQSKPAPVLPQTPPLEDSKPVPVFPQTPPAILRKVFPQTPPEILRKVFPQTPPEILRASASAASANMRPLRLKIGAQTFCVCMVGENVRISPAEDICDEWEWMWSNLTRGYVWHHRQTGDRRLPDGSWERRWSNSQQCMVWYNARTCSRSHFCPLAHALPVTKKRLRETPGGAGTP